jgi:hypothetical protein
MSRTPKSPIRIATAAYPPFATDCGVYTLKPTKECPYPGVDHEILYFLLEYAKVPYQLFPLTGEVDFGEVQPDGTVTGLMSDVVNGKYDTVSTIYGITEKRSTQVKFFL